MIPTQTVTIKQIMTKERALKLLESNDELSPGVLDEIRLAFQPSVTPEVKVEEDEKYESSTDADSYYYESSEAEYEDSNC